MSMGVQRLHLQKSENGPGEAGLPYSVSSGVKLGWSSMVATDFSCFHMEIGAWLRKMRKFRKFTRSPPLLHPSASIPNAGSSHEFHVTPPHSSAWLSLMVRPLQTPWGSSCPHIYPPLCVWIQVHVCACACGGLETPSAIAHQTHPILLFWGRVPHLLLAKDLPGSLNQLTKGSACLGRSNTDITAWCHHTWLFFCFELGLWSWNLDPRMQRYSKSPCLATWDLYSVVSLD